MNYPVKKGRSIAEVDPHLVAEWDYERNSITPDKVSYGSGIKYSWICPKCNSPYPATPNKRHYGRGCPYCAGQKVKKGYNDLATLDPLLAKEWDYSRNVRKPDEVTARGGGEAHWICSVCGHQWKANISDRYRGTGCPKCKRIYHTSLNEQVVFYYLKKCFPDTVNGYVPGFLRGSGEIDIFIPSLNLAIEYDGKHWHQGKKDQDQKKGITIKQQGIDLIRIREDGLSDINDGSEIIIAEAQKHNSLKQDVMLKELFLLINRKYDLKANPDIDLRRDYQDIISFIHINRGDASFASVHPELLQDWDYEENGRLSPQNITAASDVLVHWKCHICGYTWTTSASDRHQGSGCAYCAGKALFVGKNDLLSQRPDLVQEWDYEKNGNITPESVTVSSDRTVSWKCSKCGYPWETRIADRSKGSGCPHCAGKVAIAGFDDLKTLHPEIAIDWDYDRNEEGPTEFRPGSNKDVNWKCHICGHEWHRPIVDRVVKKTGCKMCARKRVGLKKRIDNTSRQIKSLLNDGTDLEMVKSVLVDTDIDDSEAIRILRIEFNTVVFPNELTDRVFRLREDIRFWNSVDKEV